jgi:mycoredoxin
MKKFAFLVCVILLATNWAKVSSLWQPKARATPLAQGEVVLYSTSWCGYCKLTRELLAREGVSFTEHDIERSEYGKKMHKALGGGGIPVLEVGSKVIRGYDETSILRAIKGG